MVDATYYLSILRDIRDVSFATVNEEGKPTVRVIDVMLVDGDVLYFVAARGKAFYRDVVRTRYVAIVGFSRDYKMIRLAGDVEKPKNQQELIDQAFEENPSMNELYPGESRYILDVFSLSQGHGEYFDLSVLPIFRQSFRLGDGTVPPQGFTITERCTGCKRCLEACPQHCISPGSPYRIHTENCLHCGLCLERCPAAAVEAV